MESNTINNFKTCNIEEMINKLEILRKNRKNDLRCDDPVYSEFRKSRNNAYKNTANMFFYFYYNKK